MNKIIIRKKHGIINFVFYMLLFFSTISYYGYFCKALKQGVRVLNYYMYYHIEVDILDEFIRFAKDILIIVLTILSLFNPIRKNKWKIYTFFFLVIFYGIFVLYAFSGYSTSLVLAGCRGFTYLFAMMLYLVDWEFNRPSLKIIYRLTLVTLFIQLIVVYIQMQQAIPGRIFQLAGRGAYRFTGLFGGQNSISSYVLGAVMFVNIYWICIKETRFYSFFFVQIISFFLVMSTGNRAALIGIALFDIFVLATRIPIKKNQKWPWLLGCSIVGIPILIKIIESIVERGNILRVQLTSGRILILMRVIFESSFINVLFGKGLGYGTNAYANLDRVRTGTLEAENIMDGTLNTLLVQFGMVGLAFLIFWGYKCVRYLFARRDGNTFLKVGWVLTNLVMMLASNVLENYTLLIYSILSYYLLCNKSGVVGVNYASGEGKEVTFRRSMKIKM